MSFLYLVLRKLIELVALRLRSAEIANRRHLGRVLRTYVDRYNGHRPHRGFGLAAPDRAKVVPLASRPSATTPVRRRGLLGGLINEYRAAA